MMNKLIKANGFNSIDLDVKFDSCFAGSFSFAGSSIKRFALCSVVGSVSDTGSVTGAGSVTVVGSEIFSVK